jgi:hypothetical protein
MRVGPLVAANITAPLAWLVFLQAEYALVPWACHHGARHHPVLLAIAAATFLIASGSALLGWREWRLAGRRPADEPPPAGRAAFMALTGIGISLLFMLLILASSAGFAIFTSCD